VKGESVKIKGVHWIQAKHNLGFRNVQYVSLLFSFSVLSRSDAPAVC